jgi:sugar phosphate isomerase/epimerase
MEQPVRKKSGRPDRIFGFNIFSIPVEEVLEYARDNDLRHIEINLTESHSCLNSFEPSRIEAISAFTEAYDIGLSLHIPATINISDIIRPMRRAHSRKFREYISLAGALNASHITAHVGTFYWFPVERWMRKKALKRFVESMNEHLELCAKHHVSIALENVVPIPHGSDYVYLGDNIDDFAYLFTKLDCENIRFCLDTGHANLGEGVDRYLTHFADQLVTIHYHDNNGTNDEHLPVGDGTIDWTALSRSLVNLKYDGPLISECRKLKPHESANKFKRYFDHVDPGNRSQRASPVNS